jgi:hypothetical protein
MQHFLLRPVSVQQHVLKFLQHSISLPTHCNDRAIQSLRHITRSHARDKYTSHLLRPSLSCRVSNTDAGPDPYNYTSGRWLRNDATERKSRYIRFDFKALCARVIKLCPGASSITSYDKKEGGFNRVFIFHMDNAKCIVARLSFSLAGLARLTTHSEVATITYRMSLTAQSR